MFKFYISAIVLIVIVSLGLLIDGRSALNRAIEPTTPRQGIRTTEKHIFAQGRIEGATEEAELRSQLHGQLVELSAREGQLVSEGQILLRIDDREYRHGVALAKAQLRLAEADLSRLVNGARAFERREAHARYDGKLAELRLAELTYQRTSRLLVENAVSAQAADDSRAKVAMLQAEVTASRAQVGLIEAPAREDEVSMARARIATAQARLDLAELQLDRTMLRAPSTGRILSVAMELGELAGPDTSTPTIVMADTSRYRIRALVEELDAPLVKVGMVATITADGLSGHPIRGRVTEMSPRMTNKQIFSDDPSQRYDTKSREVWIAVEEPSHAFVIGLRVDVVIDLDVPPTESVPVTRSSPEADNANPVGPTGFQNVNRHSLGLPPNRWQLLDLSHEYNHPNSSTNRF